MIHKDIFSIVFRYLPVRDRAICLTVCREWFTAAAEFNEWTEEQFKECVDHNLLYFVQHTNIDPSIGYNYAIWSASHYGYTNMVKILLADPRVDLSADGGPLQRASYMGHTEVVKLLLADPKVNPSTENEALYQASYRGHIEVVKLLLGDQRVHKYINNALNVAFENNRTKVVELLQTYKN